MGFVSFASRFISSRIFKDFFRDLRAAEKSRKLAGLFLLIQILILVEVIPFCTDFLISKVRISHRGDLRKVGDAENLMLSSDVRQAFRYFLGSSSADAGVNLIEDQGRDIVRIGEDGLDRQHDPLRAHRRMRLRRAVLAGYFQGLWRSETPLRRSRRP